MGRTPLLIILILTLVVRPDGDCERMFCEIPWFKIVACCHIHGLCVFDVPSAMTANETRATCTVLSQLLLRTRLPPSSLTQQLATLHLLRSFELKVVVTFRGATHCSIIITTVQGYVLCEYTQSRDNTPLIEASISYPTRNNVLDERRLVLDHNMPRSLHKNQRHVPQAWANDALRPSFSIGARRIHRGDELFLEF